MPKVFITQEQKDKELIGRIIKSRMTYQGMKQKDLAKELHISPQALSYMIKHGAVTLADFMAFHRILKFTQEDISKLIGGFYKEKFDE